jgi:hypothetical protein
MRSGETVNQSAGVVANLVSQFVDVSIYKIGRQGRLRSDLT